MRTPGGGRGACEHEEVEKGMRSRKRGEGHVNARGWGGERYANATRGRGACEREDGEKSM